MAAVELTIQEISLAGNDVSSDQVEATADGNYFANTGREFVFVTNGSGSSVTFTATAQTECDYGHLHDIDVAIPAGENRLIGPFPIGRFNDSNNNCQIEFTAVTDVDILVAKL